MNETSIESECLFLFAIDFAELSIGAKSIKRCSQNFASLSDISDYEVHPQRH